MTIPITTNIPDNISENPEPSSTACAWDVETDKVYPIDVEVAHLNENNVLKPHAYQLLFNQICEKHLSSFGLSVDATKEYGLAWALVSLTIEVERPITNCLTLYAKTWHSQHKGPYFRRELVFQDKEGCVYFKGSTFSVLLDMEKRRLYRSRTVPFPMPDPIETYVLDDVSATFKTKAAFQTVEERKVHNSDVDCLGHVNNCRYAEFAYDCFTKEEKASLHHMRRLEIYFISELRPEDTFRMERASGPIDGSAIFRGYNNMKENTAFDIVIHFS